MAVPNIQADFILHAAKTSYILNVIFLSHVRWEIREDAGEGSCCKSGQHYRQGRGLRHILYV